MGWWYVMVCDCAFLTSWYGSLDASRLSMPYRLLGYSWFPIADFFYHITRAKQDWIRAMRRRPVPRYVNHFMSLLPSSSSCNLCRNSGHSDPWDAVVLSCSKCSLLGDWCRFQLLLSVSRFGLACGLHRTRIVVSHHGLYTHDLFFSHLFAFLRLNGGPQVR
jgi:hypothetical protein